jgi:hypothetical protein
MRAFVEDHLLTKSGFRDNLALETALEFPGVTRPLIDTLVSRRLLRIEDRLGVQRVELTHDVLAEVIRASRDTRQQRRAICASRADHAPPDVAGADVAAELVTVAGVAGSRGGRFWASASATACRGRSAELAALQYASDIICSARSTWTILAGPANC